MKITVEKEGVKRWVFIGDAFSLVVRDNEAFRALSLSEHKLSFDNAYGLIKTLNRLVREIRDNYPDAAAHADVQDAMNRFFDVCEAMKDKEDKEDEKDKGQGIDWSVIDKALDVNTSNSDKGQKAEPKIKKGAIYHIPTQDAFIDFCDQILISKDFIFLTSNFAVIGYKDWEIFGEDTCVGTTPDGFLEIFSLQTAKNRNIPIEEWESGRKEK